MFAALAGSVSLFAAPPKPSVAFGDHMVLQRDRELSIPGVSVPGDRVTVTLAGKTFTGTADDQGNFKVKVGPFAAGGPYELTLTGQDGTTTIKDLLVGEVWMCSGQSNMQWAVQQAINGAEEVKNAVFAALSDAAKALNSMRATEGTALKIELEERIALLENLRESLLPEVSTIEQNIKNKLLEKLANANLPVDVNDERFLKEVLYYADKSDVTEELTRLASHFVQFRNFLNGAEGGGRSMDFLVQEMFREITTLGNKAGSGPVASVVIKFKTELEKIREQIQNIQ